MTLRNLCQPLDGTYPLSINTIWNTAEHGAWRRVYRKASSSWSSLHLSFLSRYVLSMRGRGDEVLRRGKRCDFMVSNEQKACRSLQKLPPLQALQLQSTVIETKSVCTVHVCESLSVLLQSFSQQIVEAGNHRSGIVVQACCDHGVVVYLEYYMDKEK